MRFCPNCGETLENDAVFCPNCGKQVKELAENANEAPAEAAETVDNTVEAAGETVAESCESCGAACEAAPAKKKKSKAGLIIAIVLAALLAAAAALYFTGALKKLLPSSRAKLALAEKALVEETLDKYFDEQKRILGADGKLDMKADVDMTIALDTEGTGWFSELGIISALIDQFKVKVGLDMSENGNNIGLGIIYKDNPVLDGKLLVGKDSAGLYIPQLDDKYYTISREALAKLFAESSEDSEIDASAVASLDLAPLDEAKTRKEVMELLMKIGSVSTDKNTQIEKDREVKLFDGAKTVPCTDYTVTPSAEELEKAILDTAEYLGKEDCYIAGRINGFMQLTANDGEEASKSISEYLKTNAHKIAEELTAKHFSFKVSMADDVILSQRVIMDGETYGIDTEKTETEEHSFLFADGEKKVRTDCVMNIADANRRTGTVKVSGDDYYDTEVAFDFDLTKLSALKTSPGTATVKVEGKEFCRIDITENGDAMEHVIVIPADSLTIADADIGMDITGLNSITFKAVASEGSAIEAPAGVEPTDLSDKSAEEIGSIFESMIEQLGGVLTGMFLPF